MKNEKDLLRYTLVNLKDIPASSKDLVKIWEGFFRYINSKSAYYKYVIIPEFGVFSNRLIDMTSIEKQLNYPNASVSPSYIDFYPNSKFITHGKFKNYPKMEKNVDNCDRNSKISEKSYMTGFSKYNLSYNGSSNPDKFVVKLEKVAKITEIDQLLIKLIFRQIIENMIYLKDHFDLALDIKMGTLFLSKEIIEYKAYEYCNKIPMLNDLKSQSFSNQDIFSNNYTSKNITESQDHGQMTLQEKLNVSDYMNRIEYLKNRQINKTDNPPVEKPYFMGMQSGYDKNRPQSIKIDTEIPQDKDQYRAILDQQRYDKLKKKLLDFDSDKEKSKNMISNDMNLLHKSIYNYYDKKNVTKEELDLHNSILKQTKKLKDDEEKEYFKQEPPQYFPFIYGDIYKEDRLHSNIKAWSLNQKYKRVPTPRKKIMLYNKWENLKPVYERTQTPKDKRDRRGRSHNKDVVQVIAQSELDKKIQSVSDNEKRKQLEVQNYSNLSILKDLDMRHKRKIMSLTNQEMVKDQIEGKYLNNVQSQYYEQ